MYARAFCGKKKAEITENEESNDTWKCLECGDKYNIKKEMELCSCDDHNDDDENTD